MAHSFAPSARADVYTRITDEIVSAIEKGAGEWRMPWHHDGGSITRPRNVTSDNAERGLQVRRGERATTVVFWKQIGKHGNGEATADDDGEGFDQDGRHGRPRFFARGYYVFNEAQVDGQIPREPPRLPECERIARADAFFAALGIPIVMEGSEACYRPYIDTIFMPPFDRFVDAASFYSCLGHECGHAVGAAHRLNRDLTGRFGSASYAMDEVVAELTSSFVMADLGITHRPREEHAAYIASWLPVLKSDPRAIFIAAGKAQQAADWMHAQQPGHRSPMPHRWSPAGERERVDGQVVTGPTRPGERLPAGPSRRTSHGQVATQDRLE